MLSFHAAILLRQIRLRTETLTKIKEENVAVAAEIAAERRVKKKLSQHRVRLPGRTLLLFQEDESTCRVENISRQYQMVLLLLGCFL